MRSAMRAALPRRGTRAGNPVRLAAALAVVLAGTLAVAGIRLALAAQPSGPAFNPVSGNQGYLVFVQGNAALNLSDSEGPVALGGDLSMSQTNLALGRPIVASSTSSTQVAANADDGDPSTYWQSTTGALPQTLTVDLGSTRTVNRIVLRLPAGFATRTQTLSVLGSLDGSAYTTVAASAGYTFDPGTGNEVTVNFGSTNRRYLRLSITANTAVAAGQISEFEAHPPGSGQGNAYDVATQTAGTFTAAGDAQPTGLLVGGRMDWAVSAPNGYIFVHSNGYVKVGDLTGTDVAQRTGDVTHLVATGGGYNSQPGLSLEVTQPTASVNQSGLIDFAGAFGTYRTRASELAVCDNTVVLRDAGGNPLPATIAPGTNARITLTTGVQNVLNVTAANLANISTLTFLNQPSASTPLIVNVYTAGVGDTFSWTVPSTNGLADAAGAYVLWNFATATRLTTTGSSPVRGTLYAPGAGLFQYNGGGVFGGVVAKSYAQGGPAGTPSGGRVRNLPFAATIQSCGAPALTITKTADALTTTGGATVRYTVTVTNSGGTNYSGATFTDPLADVLDDAAYNNDAVATAGAVSYTSPNLTWTGDLTVGASATISYSATVASPSTGNHRLLNTVTSTTPGSNCAAGSTDSRCTADVPLSHLVIDKTVDTSTVALGGVVQYTVTVTNAGQTAYTAISVADDLSGALDDAVYNADAAATAGAVVFSSPNLTWTGNLAVGAAVSVTFSMTVNNPSSGDRVLINVASSAAAGNNCGAGSADTRCRKAVGVLVPGLTISKVADVATTAPGSTVHYTVTISNSGQTAYTGITVTDALAGVLDDADYNNDAAATVGSMGFTSPNLAWTGDIAVGAAAVVITYSATVRANGGGNHILTNVLTSSAAGNNCGAGSSDPRCTVAVSVAELVADFIAAEATVSPGGVVHLSTTLTNIGQVPYTGISFSVPTAGITDDAASNGDQVASSGEFLIGETGAVWTGNVPVGGEVTVSGSITVYNPDTGDQVIEGRLTTTAAGSTCPLSNTNPQCAINVDVLVPELTVAKSADAAATVEGGDVNYTVTVTNSGNTAYTGATVADDLSGVLDDATYNADASATSGGLSYTAPTLTWTGNLSIGQVVTITYSATVNTPDTGDRAMVDTVASSDAGSTCPPASGNPSCTRTVVVLASALTIAKTADVQAVTPGGVVSYTLTITNTGQLAYTGASVTDGLAGVLDDATYNSDAASSAGGVSFSTPNLTWTGDLAVGAEVTVTYSVTVNNPDLGDLALTNVVTSAAAGNNCPNASTDPRCTVTVPVQSATTLTFEKTANRTATTPGDTITYTVAATNSGLTTYIGATFTDSLAGVLDDAVYNNDAAASSGLVTYLAPNLTWLGDIGAGATVTITYTVTVNTTPVSGHDDSVANTLSSLSVGNNCGIGSTDPRCADAIPVAHLVITNSISPSSTTPGSVITFTALIENDSPVTQYGVVLTLDPAEIGDDVTGNGDQTASSGQLTVTPEGVTWTGDIASGTTVTLTATATVNDPDTGDRVITSVVVSDSLGSNCLTGSTDPDCTAEINVLVPELTIVKTADAPTALQGGTVGYTITVTNSGTTTYTGATVDDDLSGVLDDAGYNADASATSGSVGLTGSVLTWTGDLTPSQSATITYTVTVDSPDTGDRLMVNDVSSTEAGSSCPPASGTAGCVLTVAVLVPNLTIAKSAASTGVVPGGVVSYTVTLTNSGPLPYTAISVTDGLSGVLDDATYNADAGATAGEVAFTNPNLTWTGDLAPGAVVTVTYSVTVDDPDTGNGVLANAVTSAAAGGNCPTGGSDPRCTTSLAVSILTILNTANVVTTTPGGVVQHTVTMTNSGQVPYATATVAFALDDILDDAYYNGDGTVTSGTIELDPITNSLVWTGALGIGETATFVSSVTVNDPVTGNSSVNAVASSSTPGNNCPTGSTDPSCTSIVDILVPALTIVKSADVSSTTPGGTVNYTVTVTNSGETPYDDAVVTDSLLHVLDDATYNGDAAASSGAVAFTSPDLAWTGDLGTGGVATITYSVTVDNPDTGDQSLENTVTSTVPGSSCPPSGGNSACDLVIGVLLPHLTIVKAADRAGVTAGHVVNYTITLVNSGQTAYADITVTDDLTGVLDDATYNADAAVTAGTVDVSGNTLTWSGDLAVGASAVVTYSVTVNSPDTGDHAMANTLSTTAVGSNCPDGSTDPRCATTVTVLTTALDIGVSADTASIVEAGTVHYSILLTNNGELAYADLPLTNDLAGVLDDAVYNTDAEATAGVVGVTGSTLTWVGDLAIAEAVTITYSVTVNAPAAGDQSLVSVVSSDGEGSSCPPPGSAPGCTATTAVVARTLTLSDLSPTLALSGSPQSTTVQNAAVTMTVTTNSPTGYVVTVQAGQAQLTATAPGSTATIPIGSLAVRETGTGGFQPLSDVTAVQVHSQSGPSAPGGDPLSNDFQTTVPLAVTAGDYAGTLTYVAITP